MKISFRLKTIILFNALKHVFRQPRYVILAIIVAVLMAGLTIWSLNLELLRYIAFESPLNFFEKIEFFGYGYEGLFTSFDSLLSLGIIVFSIFFGVNIALLVFVVRRHGFSSIPKKSGGSAFVFAILGGGCIACGTSLIAPILVSLGAVSAPLLRDLGAIFNWLGSLLLVYSIYKLSLLVRVKPVNTKVAN